MQDISSSVLRYIMYSSSEKLKDKLKKRLNTEIKIDKMAGSKGVHMQFPKVVMRELHIDEVKMGQIVKEFYLSSGYNVGFENTSLVAKKDKSKETVSLYPLTSSFCIDIIYD